MPKPPVKPGARPSQKIVGSSPAIRAAIEHANEVARYPLSVLINGETGTGKENIARLIHQRSKRPGRFVPVNCGVLRPERAEADLFGHIRGSFTGAVDSRPGLIELAHRGTLFLDELGELEPSVQVMLLRVLQEGTFRPVGGRRERQVDLRVVSATNRDLSTMVLRGAFREDLFHRLSHDELELPALRNRGGDAVEIALYLLETDLILQPRQLSLSAASRRLIMAHHWPGNVRELQKVLWRVAIHGKGSIIEVDQLRRAIFGDLPEMSSDGGDIERIVGALQLYGALTTAELVKHLGVPRTTLQRWTDRLKREGRIREEPSGRAPTFLLAFTRPVEVHRFDDQAELIAGEAPEARNASGDASLPG